jgi:hypothetical protein
MTLLFLSSRWGAFGAVARLRLDAGPRLAELPCTLVWATTWLADANTEIAPRLGLPDLPVVAGPEPTGAQEREDQWFGLCWTLLRSIDASRGLTDQDFAALSAWLRDLP